MLGVRGGEAGGGTDGKCGELKKKAIPEEAVQLSSVWGLPVGKEDACQDFWLTEDGNPDFFFFKWEISYF